MVEGGGDGGSAAVEATVVGDAATAAPVARSEGEGFAAVSAAEARVLALSGPQRTAIELLTSGHTLVAAATAAGVSRMTLYRWLQGDANFLAAFNAWQQDVLDTARGRVLALSDLAVNTIAKSMSGGDAKTALKVLQSMGVLERAKPGSTDPAEIKRLQDLEARRAKTAAKKAEGEVYLAELTTI